MKKQLISKILSVLFLLPAAVLSAQTSTENYVQSKTCLNDGCTSKSESITYFDGLGRPKQIINVKASPTGKDLVIPITYDGFGRQLKEILPVPASTLNSAYHQGITNENTANTYYGSGNAFSEKEIENSPLDRVLQQAHPGEPWALGSGHTSKYRYEANTGNEVKRFITTTSIVTASNVSSTQSILSVASDNSGHYPDGVLYKNTVTDEDGNPVIEFENGRGQVILVRRTDGIQNADTYYVYNEYGQKAFVIPPKAVKQIESNGNTISPEILDNFCYQYNYDGKNREVEKKLPGKGWEYTVYDKQDRPVLSQDVILRTTTNNFRSKGWLFTKYDQFGRVAYTGFFSNNATRQSMQDAINNMSANSSNNEKRSTSSFSQQGINVYYDKQAFPTGTIILLTLNYYDTYPPEAPAVPLTVQNQYTLAQELGSSDDSSTKSFLTASYVKNIEDNKWTKTYNYYDSGGRVVYVKTDNHLGGYTNKTLELDFAGQVDKSHIQHKRSDATDDLKVNERFEYDHQKRLMKHFHRVGNFQEELLTDNTYNEIGQLVNKKTGNTSGVPLQSIDYTYNIRGWLHKVNNPADLGTKLFAFELKYENPVNGVTAPAKYNGNISEFDWRTPTANLLKRYSYKYDGLNRLNDALYSEPFATAPVNNGYSEYLTYDINGNIQTLKRFQALANTPILIDDLKYELYEGNRLKKVSDENTNQTGYPTGGNMISYDLNGNMTDHLDKDISAIAYNFLNLPKEVKFGQDGKKLEFQYSADGIKLRKAYTYFASKSGLMLTNTTDYLDGFQYEQVTENALPLLQFFPTSEGYYDYEKNRYIYNYEDHVGNIRLAYYKGSSNEAVVDKETNYYPFGMEYEGFNGTNTQLPSYTYGYNGKELQIETGWNDYGARMYMSDLGRWGTIDPLAETSRRWSPYTYAFNNPIRFVDPDGKQAKDIILSLGHDKWGAEIKARYDGGKLYTYSNGKRSDIEYTGDISKVSTIVSDLDKLNANSAGKSELIDFFSKEGNDVTIRLNPDSENHYGYGTGSITVTGSTVPLPTTEGMQDADSYIILGHEMGHAKSDLKKEEGTTKEWYKKSDGGLVTLDELNATHIENKIRKAGGLPLRTRYNPNRSDTSLLTNDNKKSLYINKNQDYPTKEKVEDNYEY